MQWEKNPKNKEFESFKFLLMNSSLEFKRFEFFQVFHGTKTRIGHITEG